MIFSILFSTLAFAITFNFDPNLLVDEATVNAALSCDVEGNNNSGPESLCSGSYESLCRMKPSPSLINGDQFRKRIWKQNGARMSRLEESLNYVESKAQSQKAMKEYAKIFLNSQRAVEKEAAKYGVATNGLRSQLELVKETLVARLAERPNFSGREQAMLKVQKIELLDASALQHAALEDVEAYFMSCGIDGLVPQAAYDPRQNKVVVCTGYFLDNLKKEGLDAMNLLLGHEIAHAVGPLDKEAESKFSFRKNYDNYLSCVRENYGSEFLTRGQAMRKKVAKQKVQAAKCMKAMRAKHSTENEIAMAQRLFAVPNNAQHGPANEDAVKSHDSELVADLMGAEISGRILAKEPIWDRPAIIRAQLSFFCNGQVENMLHEKCGLPFSPASERGEDGEHPNFRYRVESTLRNPKIRDALGCAARPSSAKPWCSL